MKRMYKFYWDCGRSGNLEGLFIAEEKDVAKAINSPLYFSEVLGKHSEVYGTLNKGDATCLDIPEEVVLLLEKELGQSISGFNPMDYLACGECGAGQDDGCSCDLGE